jgi:hypothetical protein
VVVAGNRPPVLYELFDALDRCRDCIDEPDRKEVKAQLLLLADKIAGIIGRLTSADFGNDPTNQGESYSGVGSRAPELAGS